VTLPYYYAEATNNLRLIWGEADIDGKQVVIMKVCYWGLRGFRLSKEALSLEKNSLSGLCKEEIIKEAESVLALPH